MNLIDYLIEPYKTYTIWQIIIEILATSFGLLSVFFSIKKKIWVYPTGMISTILYIYIFLIFGLLGDMLINVYYTIMSVYGWMLWAKNQNEQYEIKVEKTSKKEWKIAGILFIFSMFLVSVIYYYKPILDRWMTGEEKPVGLYHLDWANWLDVGTTSLFLVGMWLMAKRRIENWIFWIVADIVCIPMSIYKGLGITSIQFFIFSILAIKGYRAWQKTFHLQNEN